MCRHDAVYARDGVDGPMQECPYCIECPENVTYGDKGGLDSQGMLFIGLDEEAT